MFIDEYCCFSQHSFLRSCARCGVSYHREIEKEIHLGEEKTKYLTILNK